ncbi:MAG: glycosyltransferase family 4 protein [Sedimentisphaerales bacterium]|nr:glycosyltransferase family 4 protein [Sedimentisphaerales bacterium]
MKQTVFITFFPAYPPRAGAASVSYNFCKYSTGSRWLIQISDKDRVDKLDDEMTVISIAAKNKTKCQKISGLFNRIKKIADKVKEINPDTIYFEGASWVLYFVLLYRKLRKNGIKSKIIYHSHNVEYVLRKQKHGFIVTAITKWSERYLLTHCDYCTAVSEIDVQHFKELYSVAPIVLPNGVDFKRFDMVNDEQVQSIKEKYQLPNKKTVLFMGLIGYKPNDEAVDFLVWQVFPKLINKVPDAKLVIIGGTVKERHEWLINPGNIPPDDLPAFIKACEICVSPIFSGSGTRLKILEYLAAEKLIISTSKGAEGLGLIDKEQIIFAEDAITFIEQIIIYFNSPREADKLIKNGKSAIKKFDWIKITQDFQKVIVESK